MRREALSSALGMVLMLGGCPKRQTTSRIVYVPSAPAAQAPASTAPSDSIQITEPAPPEEPVVVIPTEEKDTPKPKADTRRRRVARSEPPESTTEASEETEPPAAGPPPALETRDDPAIRSEVLHLQADLQTRIEGLERQELSKEDQKTFEDAKVFLEQAGRALDQGDSQRALMLARKASLLVSALQK